MKKHIFLTLFFFTANLAVSQARMVMNNNANLVINSNAFLVIENSNPNAITLAGTGGNIISEAENNRVRWKTGNTIGAFVIPFAKGATKIPLTLELTSAGTATGFFDFSTYGTATWNNDLNRPSMVSHMAQFNAPGAPNNSERVIDRFWLMNPIDYSTKPSSKIIFTYIDSEHASNGGNLLVESDLGAQRFNNGPNTWGDMLPIGTVNITNNTVTTGVIAPANFYAAWTLSQVSNPLSVQLLSFTANCSNQQVNLKWKTGSELNSSHFQILQSADMVNWEEVGKIPSHGNSSVTNSYEFKDENTIRTTAYYRLVEYDLNNNSKILSTISSDCEDGNAYDVSLYPNPNNGSFNIQIQTNEKMDGMVVGLFDLTGRLLKSEVWSVEPGISEFSLSDLNLRAGSYVIKVDAKQKQTQVIRFVVN
jgi:hypothetical protein